MKTEYDCERCGIRVVHCIPQPDETLFCSACGFIEGIEDAEAKRQVAEALDRHNPMFGDANRVRDAFRDWGDGERSVSFLITGRLSRANDFHAEIGGEDFGRRKSTTRLRLWLPPGESPEQTIKRIAEAASRHRVTCELLHGAGESEWYETIHLAAHNGRWGKEE